jgi:hypothetical protein
MEQPDRHAALAFLAHALPSLDTPVPGLRNEGLFALHALTVDAHSDSVNHGSNPGPSAKSHFSPIWSSRPLRGRLTLNMLLSFAQFEREIEFSVLSVFACAPRIRPSYRTSPSIGWGIVQR